MARSASTARTAPTSRGSALLTAVAAAGFAVLLLTAGRAEAAAGGSSSQAWLVPAVAVGLASSAAAMPGPRLARILLALTAVAWLAGSVTPWLLLAHQASFLASTLALRPAGRLPAAGTWARAAAALVLGIPLSLGMVDQSLVALAFLGTAGAALISGRGPYAAGRAIAGILLGVALLGMRLISHLDPVGLDPAGMLLAYEGVLLAAAAALVLSSRAEAARTRELVDRLVTDTEGTGLSGLRPVLEAALRADGLTLVGGASRTYRQGELAVPVEDEVVVVRHPDVDDWDERLREDVSSVVRLVHLETRRRTVLEEQSEALHLARRRVLEARDAQQAETARQLDTQVLAPLHEALQLLDALPRTGPDATAAVEIARAQIVGATREVEQLVRGAPPRALGHGRIVRALRAAADHGGPVEVLVEGSASASAEVETVLYYVCAEAIVNVQRHARASRAVVLLEQSPALVRVTVTDDGVGGADPTGSGLSGLADRVAVHGGRLRVESPPGAGTVLVVELPTNRVPRAVTPRPASTTPASRSSSPRR